jgi:hypothetical protein
MYDGAERKAALPRGRHVCDVDVTITFALMATPLLQALQLASHGSAETVIGRRKSVS